MISWLPILLAAKITVKVTPQLCIAPCHVVIRIEIRSAIPELYCPEYSFEYGDGRYEAERSDCDPYGEWKDTIYKSREYKYHSSGEYQLRVEVKQSGKKYPFTKEVIVR